MDVQGRDLSETVWTRLDRKAGAVIELTIRQLRHKISTWVVMALGVILMILLLAFYVDSIRDEFEPIDNDGDSVDENSLREAGLVNGRGDGVKILARGDLEKKLTIKANAFSSAAKSAIESKGGACEVVSKPASSGDE